jgi:poly-gamma-glutamate capsule biosynthesis protein CapA/YwtB (metallophosphatase superfamily)
VLSIYLDLQIKYRSMEDTNRKENTVNLVMVGDVLIHDVIYNKFENGKYNFKPFVSLIKPIIQKYDIAFYNQESILGGKEINLSTYPCFNSPYEVGDAMIDAGFNMVSLANNHTMDRGQRAIENSIKYWKKYPHILTAGSYVSETERNEFNIRINNDITYTLLSYTNGTNGIRVPKDKEYLVNIFNFEKVQNDILKIRPYVDLLMVSMHWGTEYAYTPTQLQIKQANFLADLGVDIIIGHHPHVIQPITRIKNTIVIYSLGNFISGQTRDYTYTSLMCSLSVHKNKVGVDTVINIDNVKVRLMYDWHTKNFTKVKVIPFSIIEDKYLQNSRYVYNFYKDIVTRYNVDIDVEKINPNVSKVDESQIQHIRKIYKMSTIKKN